MTVDNKQRLVTLDVAVTEYEGVTVPMLRAWIRRGELPAVRAGKAYLISPADLAARLAPRSRPQATRERRETPSQRAARQLAESGIVLDDVASTYIGGAE